MLKSRKKIRKPALKKHKDSGYKKPKKIGQHALGHKCQCHSKYKPILTIVSSWLNVFIPVASLLLKFFEILHDK